MPMGRRVLEGIVLKAKMNRSVIAQVSRKILHPRYGKVIVLKKNYMVHDPTGSLSVGDKISMVESRPLSKNKRWALYKVIDRVKQEV